MFMVNDNLSRRVSLPNKYTRRKTKITNLYILLVVVIMSRMTTLVFYIKQILTSYIFSLVAKSDMQNKFCVILQLTVAVILNKSTTLRSKISLRQQ